MPKRNSLPIAEDDRLVGAQETATAWDISRRGLRQLVQQHRIHPGVKIGRDRKWPLSYVRKVMAEGVPK